MKSSVISIEIWTSQEIILNFERQVSFIALRVRSSVLIFLEKVYTLIQIFKVLWDRPIALNEIISLPMFVLTRG